MTTEAREIRPFGLLVIGLTLIVTITSPSANPILLHGPQTKRYLGTTLFDWELLNLPVLNGFKPLWMARAEEEADCRKCAAFAAQRYALTGQCLENQRHIWNHQRGWRTSLLLPKIFLTFPIWIEPFFAGLLINFATHYSWLFGIAIIAYSLAVMIVIAIDPEGDVSKSSLGVLLLYQKSYFKELTAWFVLVYGYVRQIRIFGSTPDLASPIYIRLSFFTKTLSSRISVFIRIIFILLASKLVPSTIFVFPVLKLAFKPLMPENISDTVEAVFGGQVLKNGEIYLNVYRAVIDEFRLTFWDFLEFAVASLLFISSLYSVYTKRQNGFFP